MVRVGHRATQLGNSGLKIRQHVSSGIYVEDLTEVQVASHEEIEAMIKLVTPEYEALERKRWMAQLRANASEQIRAAFMMGDTDGGGGEPHDGVAEAHRDCARPRRCADRGVVARGRRQRGRDV